MKNITTEEFINRAILVHRDRYSYVNTEYIAMLKKVAIICLKHGEFWQTPADHLWNHGCNKCKGDKSSFTWEEIYNQFPEKNKTYYSYDKDSYTRNSVKMKIICPKHGEFWQKPELHKTGSGCKRCTASGGPGRYCETIFSRSPELKEKQGLLYFIELIDSDNRIFYKVGITTSMRTRYYNFIKKNGGKILWTKNDTLYNCFILEQNILEENKLFKYIPIMPLAGKNECLTRKICDI
jgi:hypothetical protein